MITIRRLIRLMVRWIGLIETFLYLITLNFLSTNNRNCIEDKVSCRKWPPGIVVIRKKALRQKIAPAGVHPRSFCIWEPIRHTEGYG
jgi:hypothetical protein